MDEPRCRGCSGPMPPTARLRKRYCSPECYAKWRSDQERAEVLAAKQNRPCSSCGSSISLHRRKDALHCSDECKSLARTHRRYGMTWEELQLLRAQHGSCAICGTSEWGNKGPQNDHNHKTGRIRGVLCSNCNNGLGRFQDDPAVLRAAADYLERGNL